jgi:hypothetical protein
MEEYWKVESAFAYTITETRSSQSRHIQNHVSGKSAALKCNG